MWQIMNRGICKYIWGDVCSKYVLTNYLFKYDTSQTVLSTNINNRRCIASSHNLFYRNKTNEILLSNCAKFHTHSVQLKNNISKIDKSKVPVLNENDLEESFVRGSGPGGQSVAKTNSACCLRHIPTGIRVKCHQQRSLIQNRQTARKLLIDRLDDIYNGDQSVRAQKERVEATKKAKRKQKSKKNAELRNAWKEQQEHELEKD